MPRYYSPSLPATSPSSSSSEDLDSDLNGNPNASTRSTSPSIIHHQAVKAKPRTRYISTTARTRDASSKQTPQSRDRPIVDSELTSPTTSPKVASPPAAQTDKVPTATTSPRPRPRAAPVASSSPKKRAQSRSRRHHQRHGRSTTSSQGSSVPPSRRKSNHQQATVTGGSGAKRLNHNPQRQSHYSNPRYGYPTPSTEPKEKRKKSSFLGSVFGTVFCQPKWKRNGNDDEETQGLLYGPSQQAPQMQQHRSSYAHNGHGHRRKPSDQSYQSHRSSHHPARKSTGSAAGSLEQSSTKSSPRKSYDSGMPRERRHLVDRRIERDFGDVETAYETPSRPRRKSKGEREVAFVTPPATATATTREHHRKRSKDVNSSEDEYQRTSRRRSSRTADPFIDPPANGSAKKNRRSKRYSYEDEYLVPIAEDSSGYDGSAYYGYGQGDYGYGHGRPHGYGNGHSEPSERRRRRTKGSGAPEEYAEYYYY